jgi:hypothetical protein
MQVNRKFDGFSFLKKGRLMLDSTIARVSRKLPGGDGSHLAETRRTARQESDPVLAE